MESISLLNSAAEHLIALLQQHNLKVVFAESCTAGLVAATLGRTPGISGYLSGSAVVYREATKTAWLDVAAEDLANPEITAVSPQVAEAMALGVLQHTPEADFSASITGYLGPDAAAQMNGVAYIGVARRHPAGLPELVSVSRVDLTDKPDRVQRQTVAAARVLDTLAAAIASTS